MKSAAGPVQFSAKSVWKVALRSQKKFQKNFWKEKKKKEILKIFFQKQHFFLIFEKKNFEKKNWKKNRIFFQN